MNLLFCAIPPSHCCFLPSAINKLLFLPCLPAFCLLVFIVPSSLSLFLYILNSFICSAFILYFISSLHLGLYLLQRLPFFHFFRYSFVFLISLFFCLAVILISFLLLHFIFSIFLSVYVFFSFCPYFFLSLPSNDAIGSTTFTLHTAELALSAGS